MVQGWSDAPLTIVDTGKGQKFAKDMVQSKSGWTLFDGDTFTGWLVQPLVKGQTVMKDGEITRGGPDRVTAHRRKGPN
jgi:dihydroorotase